MPCWQRHGDYTRDLPVDDARLLSRELGRHRAGGGRLGRDHVENALRWRVRIAGDRGVGLVDEILYLRAEPVVAARGPLVAAHSLLDDRPLSVGGDEEAVVIDAESILDRGRVYLRRHTAVVGEPSAVDAGSLTIVDQLDGCAS